MYQNSLSLTGSVGLKQPGGPALRLIKSIKKLGIEHITMTDLTNQQWKRLICCCSLLTRLISLVYMHLIWNVSQISTANKETCNSQLDAMPEAIETVE